MHDRLLLLVKNWLVIEAEGTVGILAACFIATYLGLLFLMVFVAHVLQMTKFNESGTKAVKITDTDKFDRTS